MTFEVDDGSVIAQVTSMCADRFAQDAKKYRELKMSLDVMRSYKLIPDDKHEQMIDDIVVHWNRILQIKPTDVIALFNNLHGNA